MEKDGNDTKSCHLTVAKNTALVLEISVDVHRMHLAEDADLYSMEDLIMAKKGSLLDLVEEVRNRNAISTRLKNARKLEQAVSVDSRGI